MTRRERMTGLLALALLGACGGDAPNPNGVSATAVPLSVDGYNCPQTGVIAVSTIPSDNGYYLTTFTGGTMSCGGQANGVDLYIADRQRFGCGTRVRVTNPQNNKSCVTFVGDTGPNICVEEAAKKPVIDASPAVAEALFGRNSSGWSDHAAVVATVTTDPLGCGTAPSGTTGCTADSDCNGGQTGTQKICLSSGQCGDGCHVDTDCTSGNVCDPATSQCTTPGCQADVDCPSGQVCNGAHSCVTAPGCQQDSDCNGGQTGTQQICGATGQCVSGCNSDTDCPAGESCDTSSSPGSCASTTSCSVCSCDDGSCPTDSAGDCQDGTNCLSCTQDSDCTSGWTCVSGTCTAPMYAEAPRHRSGEVRHVRLEEGVTRHIPFEWHDMPGAPAPFDLSVQAGERPLLQVASLGAQPFVRAGLDVALLGHDNQYDLELAAGADELRIMVRELDSGAVVLESDVPAVRGSAELDLVLPGSIQRRAVRLGAAQ